MQLQCNAWAGDGLKQNVIEETLREEEEAQEVEETQGDDVAVGDVSITHALAQVQNHDTYEFTAHESESKPVERRLMTQACQ